MLEAREKFPEKLCVLCGGYSPQNRAEMEKSGFLVFEEPLRAIAAVSGLVRFRQVTSGS